MQKKHFGNEEWEMGADRFGEEDLAMWEKLGLRSAPLQGGAGLIFLKPIWRLSNPNSSFAQSFGTTIGAYSPSRW